MSQSKLIYLHLQKEIIGHSHNCEVTRKRASEIISWLGIPKKFISEVLKIMRERKLIERISRDKIKIINPEKSANIDSSINELIWGEMLR